MYKLKTKITDASVKDFLDKVEDKNKRNDCFKILDLMQSITGEEPKMWGPGIVGFGLYHYRYSSGNEGDWMLTGFSPRKQALTLYLMSGFDKFEDMAENLGKFKTGKSCLYIKKLDDVNLDILSKMIKKSIEIISKRYA